MGNSDSKVAFSDRLTAFSTNQENDQSELDSIFAIPVSVEDVYEILTPDLIRGLREKTPSKLVALVATCVRLVYDMYDKSLESALLDDVDKIPLCSAVRILTRIAPFINDDNAEDAFMCQLWNASSIPRTIDDADPESVGFRIVGALTRSAFIRGFSIAAGSRAPASSVDPNRVDQNVVWGRSGGIAGLPQTRPFHAPSQQTLETRVEIVRMTVAVLSRPLFQSLGEYKRQVPIFNVLIVSGDFVHTANLFVSLLLSVLEYETAYFGIPVLSAALVTEDTSVQERLASACMDLLNVLVDPPSRGEDLNVFREILAGGISDKDDVSVLAKFLRTKISSFYQQNGALRVSVHYALRNKASFMLFVFNLLVLVGDPLIDEIKIQYGKELILALLATIASHAEDAANVGLVHTGSFILLKLSANRDFVLHVFAQSYSGEIDGMIADLKISNVAKISDLAFIVVYKLVLGKGKVLADSLTEMWLTVLCNASPFVAGLSAEAARVLVATLEKFSKPGWLTAKPVRFNAVSYVVESINNFLQYQYAASVALVYQLLVVGPRILANLDSLAGTHAVYDEDWRERSLLEPARRLINYLGPRIEEECENADVDHNEVPTLIKRISVVGILPVPHAIVVRQYQPNEQTRLWFTSFLFGIVFVSLQGLPIVDWQRVKMVTLSNHQRSRETEVKTAEI